MLVLGRLIGESIVVGDGDGQQHVEVADTWTDGRDVYCTLAVSSRIGVPVSFGDPPDTTVEVVGVVDEFGRPKVKLGVRGAAVADREEIWAAKQREGSR